MTEAKQNDDWNHTSAVLAMLGNIHRDPKKGRAFKPADFHPSIKRPIATTKIQHPKVDIGILKAIFVRDR